MTADAPSSPGPNRLSRETSPYLQQHAHNPVDWFPWGGEALDLARRQDRPILLSVGYSACHWCHVMERESFENAAIAALMNRHFVNIKVDREERPEVDEIYMAAVQAMTGSGGWPMTVFLTPDLRPFFGGTYFPPDDRYGRPGFGRVLEAVAAHYSDHRDRVEERAAELRRFLVQNAAPLARSGAIADGLVEAAVRQLVRDHDETHGGFSNQGPKFPNSGGLSLLLRHWSDGGGESALEAASHTLTQMARGGIYDHLGGGFHRYSVDERWLVPHFEKMLYDNALLVPVYLDAWQATGTDLYESVARETLDYVIREMTAPEGGYCSTQDADSEGEEGRFFVWAPEQVEEVIEDEETARLFCRTYDVTPEGNFEGRSILHLSSEPEGLARFLGVDPQGLASANSAARAALFEARRRRVAPDRDDKVIASWNGLMVGAMARGAQVLGDPAYLASAGQAARFVLDRMVPEGRLLHVYKDGEARIAACQDDYAALVAGLVDLYEATFEAGWLREATTLARAMIERFRDPDEGGFFFVDAGRDDLLVRTKNPFDGATPAGNSLAAMALLRLGALTGEADFHRCAEETLHLYARLLERSPGACPFMACALHQYLRGPLEVTVVGAEDSRRPFVEAANRPYLPTRVLSGGAGVAAAAEAVVPALAERRPGAGGGARAYVCRDSVCSAPVEDVAELTRLLAERDG